MSDVVGESEKKIYMNELVEKYMDFTIHCAQICKTATRDYLELNDKVCLQNCGYNRMYINKVYKQQINDPAFRM